MVQLIQLWVTIAEWDICFISLLVSLEFLSWRVSTKSYRLVTSSIVLHTFSHLFFPTKSFTTYQKTYPKVSWVIWSIFVHFFRSQQGLWEQRQGFLTAAAKREQQHLAEAEAEVLRHVAKLVPEAEAPTILPAKSRPLGMCWDHWKMRNSWVELLRRILLEEILEVLESQQKWKFRFVEGLQESIRVFGWRVFFWFVFLLHLKTSLSTWTI